MEDALINKSIIPIGIKSDENIPKGIGRVEGGRKGNAIATSRGGMIVRGRQISKNSPLAKTLKPCKACELGESCPDYLRGAYCKYQIDTIKGSHRMQDALISNDPVDFLRNLQSGIARLEGDIEYKRRTEGKPCLNEQKEVLFLKMQLFEMTHGKAKPAVAVQVNAPQVDMSKLMSELRASKESVVVEAEVLEEVEE